MIILLVCQFFNKLIFFFGVNFKVYLLKGDFFIVFLKLVSSNFLLPTFKKLNKLLYLSKNVKNEIL